MDRSALRGLAALKIGLGNFTKSSIHDVDIFLTCPGERSVDCASKIPPTLFVLRLCCGGGARAGANVKSFLFAFLPGTGAPVPPKQGARERG